MSRPNCCVLIHTRIIAESLVAPVGQGVRWSLGAMLPSTTR
ncbi:MAG TPA: hypothetical protein VLD17_09450 [Gemmatimonadaceae bacterium]|nr:hypothetical protein [Gemmatimonadaceae bacterium]